MAAEIADAFMDRCRPYFSQLSSTFKLEGLEYRHLFYKTKQSLNAFCMTTQMTIMVVALAAAIFSLFAFPHGRNIVSKWFGGLTSTETTRLAWLGSGRKREETLMVKLEPTDEPEMTVLPSGITTNMVERCSGVTRDPGKHGDFRCNNMVRRRAADVCTGSGILYCYAHKRSGDGASVPPENKRFGRDTSAPPQNKRLGRDTSAPPEIKRFGRDA